MCVDTSEFEINQTLKPGDVACKQLVAPSPNIYIPVLLSFAVITIAFGAFCRWRGRRHARRWAEGFNDELNEFQAKFEFMEKPKLYAASMDQAGDSLSCKDLKSSIQKGTMPLSVVHFQAHETISPAKSRWTGPRTSQLPRGHLSDSPPFHLSESFGLSILITMPTSPFPTTPSADAEDIKDIMFGYTEVHSVLQRAKR